ncbi:hypothetical protein MAJ_07244, partial [Metarhizium majus ARSEF 297]
MASEQQPITNPNPQSNRACVDNPEKVKRALWRCLTEEQNTVKAPPGLDTALETLSSSDQISRAFLDAGFQAWYAYFLATDRDRGLQESIAQLSPSALHHIASDVSKIDAHDSVTRRIQHVLFGSDQLLRLNNIELPVAPELPFSEPKPHPPKRPRLECVDQSPCQPRNSTGPLNLQFMNTDAITQREGVFDAVPQSGAGQQEIATSHTEAYELLNFDINSQYQYAWPKAKNLPFVFPYYMCTAIVKRADEAAVILSFPSDPSVCRLVFDISPTEVQHVAKELFGIRIRDENNRRCVVFEHGATMDIHGRTILRGAAVEALDRIFGHMVGAAFRQNPRRMEEISMGAMLSKCLSMEIWASVDRPSRLDFMVDAENLALIYQQLWPI